MIRKSHLHFLGVNSDTCNRLAAVDMHTAQHLVAECLGGKLAQDRTIILVTHHLTLCSPIASFILELEDGKILHQGTIPELENKGLLSKIVKAEEEPFSEVESPEKPLNDADNGDVETQPKEPSNLTKAGVLIEAEARPEGVVSLRTYLSYFRAGGTYLWVLMFAIQLAISAVNLIYQVLVQLYVSQIFSTSQCSCSSRNGAKLTRRVRHHLSFFMCCHGPVCPHRVMMSVHGFGFSWESLVAVPWFSLPIFHLGITSAFRHLGFSSMPCCKG